MKRHRFVWIFGIVVVLSTIILLPNSTHAILISDPPTVHPQIQVIDAGVIIIFFSLCGVAVIVLGVGLYYFIRWWRNR